MSIQKVTVAGGGVLGSQIAFQTAYKGFDVSIWLRSESSVERAKPKLDRLVKIYKETLLKLKSDPSAYCRGLAASPDIPAEEIDALIDNAERARTSIKLTTDYEEAFGAFAPDLVIEAIAEVIDEKKEFYGKICGLLSDNAILASNSSTFLPSQMTENIDRPERFLAMHFANQIWIYNTVEIMGNPRTSEGVIKEAVEFARAIGMIPLVLKKEQPGYLLNSMLIPLLNSAEALLANGIADVETIDSAWKLGTGSPYGPFQILDIVGLNTAYNIVMTNPEAKDPGTTPGRIAALLKEYIDSGRTGVNAKEGFYKY